MVRRAKEYILAGDVIQVVLAQRFECALRAAPFNIYRCLRIVNPSPYMFFLDLGDVLAGRRVARGDGARSKAREVTVRPIAGTRRAAPRSGRTARSSASCSTDPKEIAEHIMLVDLGRNDVGRVAAIGTVEVTERLVVERYSHVMHIVSNVRGGLGRGHGLLRRVPRHVSRRHALRRAEDPRHGDHRGARAGPARRLRRRRRLLRFLRQHGHLHRHPHHARQERHASTCRPAPGIVADSDPEREHAGVRQQGARAVSGACALLDGAAMWSMHALMIDNYDSFTYNLVQYLGRARGGGARCYRNDAITLDEIAALQPAADRHLARARARPNEAGISVALIRASPAAFPILGVCLGHQCIGAAFGGGIVRADAHHARQDLADPARRPDDLRAACRTRSTPRATTRCSSSATTLPACLEISAWTGEGEIMGVRHRELPARRRAVSPGVDPDPRGQAPARRTSSS